MVSGPLFGILCPPESAVSSPVGYLGDQQNSPKARKAKAVLYFKTFPSLFQDTNTIKQMHTFGLDRKQWTARTCVLIEAKVTTNKCCEEPSHSGRHLSPVRELHFKTLIQVIGQACLCRETSSLWLQPWDIFPPAFLPLWAPSAKPFVCWVGSKKTV